MSTPTKTFHSAHPVALGIFVSTLATAVSYLTPSAHAGEAVGLVFLAATYLLALPARAAHPPQHYGLSLGGLLEPAALHPSRLLSESARAVAWAVAISAIILPPFWIGFRLWYGPQDTFDVQRALALGGAASGLSPLLNLTLAHLLVVALPEEAFFRGYLQTSLNDRWGRGVHFLGLRWSAGLLVSSLLFALGHLATTPDLGRLAVFFPSLLFGLLRDKTGGIGAAVILHAICNVCAALLGYGYGLL